MKKLISDMRMYLFALGCAGFHTVWTSLLIVYFFEFDIFAARLVVVICFVILSSYCLKVIPKELRKLEDK